MANYDVMESTPLSNTEVLNELGKKAKERELTYREEKTVEYLKKYSKLKITDFKKAKEELKALDIARLEDEHIIKILDIMPKNGTELRAIVSNTGTVLVDESVNSILDVLKKYK